MMWDLGNLWGEGSKSSVAPPMASSYLAVMHEIHVLLVDHEPESLMSTGRDLECCQYRVTIADLASAAITMLTNGKLKFDIVMANVNSPDLHGFKLVQQAATMDIPVIVMAGDDNTFTAMRAIENGAFLYLRKPATREVLRSIWQHVAREKTRLMRERERMMMPNYNARGVEFREPIHHADAQNPNHMYGNNVLVVKDKGKGKKVYDRPVHVEDDYDPDNHGTGSSKVKRKVCTEWTQELHEKFMDAVEQLGEGRCFPKEILELMNVPGLTRMQVASHLQKCRNDNWRSPEERKSSLAVQTVSSEGGGSHQRPRRFGSMPRLGKAPSSSYHVVHDQEMSGVVGQASTEVVTDGGVETMGNGSVIGNANHNNTSHYGGGSMNGPAAPAGLYSANPNPNPNPNPRNPSEDFFTFQDMDCLIQNYSGLPPQASAGMNVPAHVPGHAGYHYDPGYHDHSSKVENRSQWSSETSNFGSDESEGRGR